jgi:hypothetical protein
MILRGRVSNVGAPVAYSTWNLPPHRSFSDFVSNPPTSDGGLGLRVQPSPKDIEALIAPLQNLPNDEKQVHFEMPASPDDAEIDVVLNMLGGESSDSTHAEPMTITAGQELDKALETRKSEGARQKRLRQVSRPTAPVEEKKKKKRRLRRLSCLDQDAGPSTLVCDEVLAEVLPEVDPNGGVHVEVEPNGCDRVEVDPNGCDRVEVDPNGCNRAEVDPNGCDRASTVARIFYEDEEEEEEISLIRKNSRHYRGSRGDSDIPSLALSALVSLQELSISDFDQALEEVIPEDMLSEPTADDMMVVCSEIPDMGLEVSRAVSRASSTLEGSLRCQDAGQDCPTHMEVTEDPSALEVAAVENPVLEEGAGSYLAPEGVAGCDLALVGSASCNPAHEGVLGNDPALVGGASCNPAPEGVQVSSPSHTSMDIHVGSSPPRSDGATGMHASMTSDKQVALEVGELDVRGLVSAGGAELTPDNVLQIVPADTPPSSHDIAPSYLGLPLFFSNLQVSQLFSFYCSSWWITFLILIFLQSQVLVDGMSAQLRSYGASVPEGALSLMQWNPLLL